MNPTLTRMPLERRVWVSALVFALALTGCTTQNAYTGEQQTSSATKGATVGALAGALLGGLTTKSLGGALVGGAVGATAGGVIGHSMDNQERALRRALVGSGVQVRRTREGLRLIMPAVLFGLNSDRITQGRLERILDSVAKVLIHYPSTVIRIDGYTDSTGSRRYNRDLSRRRADAVMRSLVAKGVRRSRLVAVGQGENDPIASNTTPQGRALNRRVEIRIQPSR